MILKLRQSECLIALISCLATGCDAQEDKKIIAWQPDVRIVSTNNVLWGIETNHIKVGLNIQYASDATNRTLVGFFVVLYNNSDTNGNFRPNLLSLGLPPVNSRYKMTLTDDSGNVVAKTKMGNDFDQPFDLNPKRIDIYHGYAVKDFSPFYMDVLTRDPIVLENYFEITNAGKYHLKFVLNTYTGVDEHRILQPFYLPVDAEIEIENP
jgi:hypothetical protein